MEGEKDDDDELATGGAEVDTGTGDVGGPIMSKYLSCDALTMRRLKSINPNKLCR